MLDIGNIYKRELLGLAVRGDKMLDIGNIYRRGVGGSSYIGRQNARY